MAKLLVIDSEESCCQLLAHVFSKQGHVVETVLSGEAAKNKIDGGDYDVIISEVRMPDVSGFELLEYARAAMSLAPFILMTAVPTERTAALAVNRGAYGYVTKTEFLVEDLGSVVEKALKEQASRRVN